MKRSYWTRMVWISSAALLAVALVCQAAVAQTWGTTNWEVTLSDNIYLTMPAISPDGATIYIVDNAPAAYAINAASGATNWRSKLEGGGGCKTTPVLSRDGSTLYAALYNGYLVSLNTTDGSTNEVCVIPEEAKSLALFERPLTSTDTNSGYLFIGNEFSNFTCFAINNLTTALWTRVTAGKMYSPASIGPDGLVYVGNNANQLIAFDMQGNTNNVFNMPPALDGEVEDVITSPAFGEVNGTSVVYMVNSDHRMWSFSLATKTTNWVSGVAGITPNIEITQSPVIGTDGYVYMGHYSPGGILRFNPINGAFTTNLVAGAVKSTPAVGANGTLFFSVNVGVDDGQFYALNPTTGETNTLWSYYNPGSRKIDSPSIGTNGTIYIGTRDGGLLYAYNNTEPLASENSFWPKLHQNTRNTGLSKPSAASITAVSIIGSDTLIGWSASPVAMDYLIYKNTTTNFGTAALVATVSWTNTAYTDAGEGVPKYYWVRARNDSGLSTVSACAIGELPPNGWLGIQVTPTGGTWQLTAPAGYTGPTAGAGNLAAVRAVTGAYGIAWGTMAGYVAPDNQTRFVISGSTTLFAGVYTEAPMAPVITVPPQSQAVNLGARAAFNVAAIGTPPLLYQWQKDAINISGATGGSYTIASVATKDAGDYRCVVANVAGAATSSVATLTVIAPTPPLDAPAGVSASDGTCADKVRITWNPVSGATRYLVYRNLAEDTATASQVGTTASAAFDDVAATNWPETPLYYWVKAANAQTTSTFSLVARGCCAHDPAIKQPVSGDFDGDSRNDLALYQESAGAWSFRLSASGYSSASATLGGSGGEAIAGDFDGDGKADPAVYDQAAGGWAIMLSGSGYLVTTLTGFGGANHVTVVADYDGDRKADPAIYQSTTGDWLVKLSGSGYGAAVLAGFGGTGYTALALDFDGDGQADPGIYQETTGDWTVKLSGSGYANAAISGFGGPGYLLVSGMYDNDARADAGIYNPANGNWMILLSASEYITTTLPGFGGDGYIPVVGDFDGDGKADPALYQAATSTWFVKLSGSGYATVTAEQ